MTALDIILIVFGVFLLGRGIFGLTGGKVRVGGYGGIPPLEGRPAQIVAIVGVVAGTLVIVAILGTALPGGVRTALLAVGFLGALAAETVGVAQARQQHAKPDEPTE